MDIVDVTEPFECCFALLIHGVVERTALQFVRDLDPLRSLFWR
jgi:hypothetical protein